jgi:hypothetical protein
VHCPRLSHGNVLKVRQQLTFPVRMRCVMGNAVSFNDQESRRHADSQGTTVVNPYFPLRWAARSCSINGKLANEIVG